MPKLASNHVHKYERRYNDRAKTVEIWQCIKPHCSHYLYKALAKGKASECWNCGEEMTLNPKNMQYKHPKCVECMRPKKQASKAIQDILKEVKGKFGGL